MLSNPEVPIGNGYSESKWVAERILDATAERTSLRPAVVRLGQVCGDGNGIWNEREWFPSLVKSALTLDCLPSLDGVSGDTRSYRDSTETVVADSTPQTASWVTAPDAATAMIEISHIDPTPDAHTFHVVHPRGVPFNALVGSVARSLNVPLVPFPEWLSRLAEEHKSQSRSDDAKHSDLERMQASNPALRLFNFYDTARTGPEWEPLGAARLDVSRAMRVSKVLAEGAKPLGEENVGKWLAAWRSSGFLPPQRRETVARIEKSSQVSTLEAATSVPVTPSPTDIFDELTFLRGVVGVYVASKFGFLMVLFGFLRLLYSYF